MEFPDGNGNFTLEEYPDRSSFKLFSGQATQATQATVQLDTPTVPVNNSTQPSTSNNQRRSMTRRAMATVKIVRADVATNGKPSNVLLHNLTVHVNLYNEEQATVGYIMQRVRDEMGSEELILVGANGLTIYDQEGTRGNLSFISSIILSLSLTLLKNMPVKFQLVNYF